MSDLNKQRRSITILVVFGLVLMLVIISYLMYPKLDDWFDLGPIAGSTLTTANSAKSKEQGSVVFDSKSDTRDTSPVQSVRSETGVSFSTAKIYDTRDVMTVLAFVFVCISVVPLCILHTIRARRDPTKKWMK